MAESKPDWRPALEAVIDERRQELGPHPELEELVAYHAGAIEDDAARRLQDHLVLCPECATLLLELDTFTEDAARLPQQPPAEVTEIRPRAAARRWLPIAAAAMAASLVFALWPRGGPLPEYELHFVDPLRSERGSEPIGNEIPTFAQGRRFALELQPATVVDEPLTARAYLRHNDGLRPLSTAILHIDRRSGTVQLDGVVGQDLHLPVGERALIFAVARPRSLPSPQQLAVQLDEARVGRRWLGLKRKVNIVDTTSGEPKPAPPYADDGPRLAYAGCQAVFTGPVCLLPEDRRLQVWVRHSRIEDVRLFNGKLYSPTAVQDGLRFEVEVEPRATELVVEVTASDHVSIWALDLDRSPDPPWLREAHRLYASDDWDAAKRLLEPRAQQANPATAGPALSLLARIARRDGQVAAGDSLYRRAIAAHREAGRLSSQIRDATGLSYHLIAERRFTEAQSLLDALPTAATGGASDSRYLTAYFRSLLAEETGDLRAAIHWMRQAAHEAEKGALDRDEIYARDLLARQLVTVGLSESASQLHTRLDVKVAGLCSEATETSPLTPCDCARLDNSRAWALLLQREANESAADPTPWLTRAKVVLDDAMSTQATCLFPEDLPNVGLNLALAALQTNKVEAAEGHLAEVRESARRLPRQASWLLDIESRIALANAQPETALALYQELEEHARQTSSPETAWRAAFGTATAFEVLGRPADASRACSQAATLLEQESLLVPMHLGRERFLAQRQVAASFCLDLLLRQQRHGEALNTVRRSMGQALRHLRASARIADLSAAERADWQRLTASYRTTRDELTHLAANHRAALARDEQEALAASMSTARQRLLAQLDELAALAGDPPGPAPESPLAPGELLLAYHPLSDGWVGFAASSDDLSVHRIDLPHDPDLTDISTLAQQLLAPFREDIEKASVLRIAPRGALRALDFHALPFGDDILLRYVPVTYPLGLTSIEPPEIPGKAQAVIVAAPGLLAAPDEARDVQRALRDQSRSWAVELLEELTVTSANLRRGLTQADLFHFAGHAEFDADSRGWDSFLALAASDRLGIDDLLALPRVPRWVVLSGCETGLDSSRTSLPNVGLAQAFLVAGSHAVVAATAVVSDTDAASLSAALYHHWNAEASLGVALQRAQLQLREAQPGSDWIHFRVLTR